MSREISTEDEKTINYYSLENDIRSLSGKILTIIDASISDKQQNKALKDLIKKEIRSVLSNWQRTFWGKEKGHSIPDEWLENK